MFIDLESAERTEEIVKGEVERRFKAGSLVVKIRKNPILLKENFPLSLLYSASCYRGEDLLLTIVIEREDLRDLSSRLSVSIKELREDYSSEGFYGKAKVVLYRGSERSVVENWEEGEDPIDTLLTLALDTFDIEREIVEI